MASKETEKSRKHSHFKEGDSHYPNLPGRMPPKGKVPGESATELAQRLEQRDRQIIEQSSRLEAILNGILDGVIVLDPDKQVIASNPTARGILRDMSGDLGATSSQTLPTSALLQELFPFEGQMERAENKMRRLKTGGRVLNVSVGPVFLPNGERLGTVIVLRDVTREAEAETLKDNFIASISHELRTPLTAIKGYSELLIRLHDNELDNNSLKFAKAINHNTNQLMQHINGLIDMSQIQAGDLNLSQEEVDFGQVVSDVLERWRLRIESKSLTLKVNQAKSHLPIFGDRDRLFWAIFNLISNAYNYTLPGGRIEVSVFQEARNARVDVKDTGVGISSSDQPFLFSRFFRARNELTFSVPGVGLGLFITKSIAERHGGRVWAKSELGVGSTFSLAVPLLRSV